MSLRSRLADWILDGRELELAKGANPRTYDAVSGGVGKKQRFTERERDPKLLEDYRNAYEQGGMITEAFNAYPQFVLSNGWRIVGDNPVLNKDVEDWLRSWDFEAVVERLILDSMIYKYAFQEKIPTVGGGIHSVKPAPSWMFEIIRDDFGRVLEIRQYKDSGWLTEYQTFTTDDLIVFEWKWLMNSAWDDIERDTTVVDGIAASIERHGFPKYHIKVGKEGENPGKDALDSISRMFRKLKPNMEMTTVHDVEILNVDTGGIPNAAIYNQFSVQRLTSALGVPEEILGLGRGSTEATANVRLQTFYGVIGALQRRVARCYNMQLIDQYTGRPGAAKLVFEDVSPVDEKMLAETLALIQSTYPIDPPLTRDEIREKFGYEPDTMDEGGDGL